jgi:hypothetical protein
VKLQNQATKIESESVTNETGYFNFVNLNPATYTLRVEVQGFKGVQTPPFEVGVSEAVTQKPFANGWSGFGDRGSDYRCRTNTTVIVRSWYCDS